MTETTHELDRIDLRILNVLQADGRIANLKLAEAVALSPTAVLARTQGAATWAAAAQSSAPCSAARRWATMATSGL